MSVDGVEVVNPDKPHEEWIVDHLKVETYEQAADAVIEYFEDEIERGYITEAFENGYWVFTLRSYKGKGKTRDAAWIDLYHDEYWYDYGWSV